MSQPISSKIYTRQFWLICVSSLLFFASFNMLLPKMNAYLTSLGGGDYKGFIISLFTITAMLSRPFSGKLADRIGRIPVMMFGAIVCIICSLLYPVLTTVVGFLFLRFIHGFSTGFTPTGNAAFLSDIIPAEKRGEGMGYLGTAGALGMAAGPAIGGEVADAFGLNAMFYCSSAFAFISVIIVATVKETLREKHPVSLSVFKIEKQDLFEPRVIVPCITMVLCAYAYGAVFTILPDLSESVGIKSAGLPFTYMTVASLFVRLVGGKASDKWGRRTVVQVSSFIIVCSMVILAYAETRAQLLFGVILYGMGQGATSPTLLAWATDLSNPINKGRGIASLYIFMELGIGLGAFLSGFIYGNDSSNFFVTFLVCSLLAALAFAYLALQPTMFKKPA